MSGFFDTYLNPKKIMASKREYREQIARVKALPEDYQFAFQKIQDYMWAFAGGDGMDMLEIQYDLIDLFEAGALEGKSVLEVTGEDVGAFADGLLLSAKTYTAKRREKLNREIHKKLLKEDA